MNGVGDDFGGIWECVFLLHMRFLMKSFLKKAGIDTIKHQYGIQAPHDLAWILEFLVSFTLKSL